MGDDKTPLIHIGESGETSIRIKKFYGGAKDSEEVEVDIDNDSLGLDREEFEDEVESAIDDRLGEEGIELEEDTDPSQEQQSGEEESKGYDWDPDDLATLDELGKGDDEEEAGQQESKSGDEPTSDLLDPIPDPQGVDEDTEVVTDVSDMSIEDAVDVANQRWDTRSYRDFTKYCLTSADPTMCGKIWDEVEESPPNPQLKRIVDPEEDEEEEEEEDEEEKEGGEDGEENDSGNMSPTTSDRHVLEEKAEEGKLPMQDKVLDNPEEHLPDFEEGRGEYNLHLLSASSCPKCNQVKQFFANRGILEAINIIEDPEEMTDKEAQIFNRVANDELLFPALIIEKDGKITLA